MINIRLFPAFMKFLIRLYLTKNYVWIRVHEQTKFNIVCSYVTTTGTATVTNRSIILYKECSNYVYSKKLSILDCFWFWFWITISWSRSVVVDKTNESFSLPLNLKYSSNFSAIFNASQSDLISGSPTVSSSSSQYDNFVQFTSCGFPSFEAKSSSCLEL